MNKRIRLQECVKILSSLLILTLVNWCTKSINSTQFLSNNSTCSFFFDWITINPFELRATLIKLLRVLLQPFFFKVFKENFTLLNLERSNLVVTRWFNHNRILNKLWIFNMRIKRMNNVLKLRFTWTLIERCFWKDYLLKNVVKICEKCFSKFRVRNLWKDVNEVFLKFSFNRLYSSRRVPYSSTTRLLVYLIE